MIHAHIPVYNYENSHTDYLKQLQGRIEMLEDQVKALSEAVIKLKEVTSEPQDKDVWYNEFDQVATKYDTYDDMVDHKSKYYKKTNCS